MKKIIIIPVLLLTSSFYVNLYTKHPSTSTNNSNSNMPDYYQANDTYDNTRQTSLTNQYTDYSSFSKYVGNGHNWDPHFNNPVFAPYVAISTSDDQDILQYVQNTGVKHLMLSFATVGAGEGKGTYPDGKTWSDQGKDNSNTIKWSSGLGGGAILPHWDMIKELRNMGVDVGLGFGGSGAPYNLFNYAPSVAGLARWYEDQIVGYGVHNVDFDIEGAADNCTAGIQRLGKSLKLITADLKKRKYSLSIKFTVDDSYTDWLKIIDDYLGNNYLLNFMTDGVSDQDISNYDNYLTNNINSFKKLSSEKINRRLGATLPFLSSVSVNTISQLLKTANDSHLGYLGIFCLQQDLTQNSYDKWINGTHSNSYLPSDFYATKTLLEYEQQKKYGFSKNPITNKIKINPYVYYSVKSYSKTDLLGTQIRWNKIKNADYYKIYFKNSTYITSRTNINLDTPISGNYAVAISAYNIKNNQETSKFTLNFNVGSSSLSMPLLYWDKNANFWTGKGKYNNGYGYLANQLFFYNNKVYSLTGNNIYGNYKSIEPSDRNSSISPDKNPNFTLTKYSMNTSGYSKQAIHDLNLFSNVNYSVSSQVLTFTNSDKVVLEPAVNGSLYSKYKYTK